MRLAATAGLIIAAVTLAGCGGKRAVEIDQDPQPVASRWNARLSTPAGLAGAIQVMGTAWMGARERDGMETEAGVSISNSAPGGRHPWHVHRGQCGTDQGVVGQADAYEVLEVEGNGEAEAEATLAVPAPRTGQYYVDVHASPSNMGTLVACGNMAPPTR
ncbi:MAG: hypothetical protein M3Q93_12135 [Gemmatimonadota bacterium]|nr:hypothetical protein [Gemmatimonadota bacterium]